MTPPSLYIKCNIFGNYAKRASTIFALVSDLLTFSKYFSTCAEISSSVTETKLLVRDVIILDLKEWGKSGIDWDASKSLLSKLDY